MMYCVRCGTKAEKGQKRCLVCGMRLVSPETLLKLLKKADLEKQNSRPEGERPVKRDAGESFLKGYMDRLHKDEQEAKTLKKKKTGVVSGKPQAEKTVKSKEKTEKAAKNPIKSEPIKNEKPQSKSVRTDLNQADRIKKRVTPLLDNPVQPRQRSIFDDEPEGRKKPAKHAGEKKDVPDKKTSKESVRSRTNSNPVVKLPEKKKTAPDSGKRDERQVRSERQARSESKLFLFPERKEARKKPDAPKKKVNARKSSGQAAARRPDRTKSAPRRPQSSAKPVKPYRSGPSSGGTGAKKTRSRREEESFVEKYLRSIISMMLLTCTVVMMLMWAYATDSGLRTMAQFGLGTRKGYILLGDDCMTEGNYKRAVEHYYKALTKKVNYEAGIKLARAYRQTGEAEKETSALLLLMDRYKGADEPYNRILELYPDPGARPEKVHNAISMHER